MCTYEYMTGVFCNTYNEKYKLFHACVKFMCQNACVKTHSTVIHNQLDLKNYQKMVPDSSCIYIVIIYVNKT